MIRVLRSTILNNHSEARAFLELRLGYFCDVGTGPDRSIRGFRIVVVPSVIGRIRSGLCLSWVKIYPAKNIPYVATLVLAVKIATHVSDV
jgi:hypothetical protein